MSRVFWDTNLFIYLIEDFEEFSQRVIALRLHMLQRKDQLYTSTLTLGEVLVKPVEARDESLRQKYEEALTRGALLVPFDQDAARLYASIRRDRTIRPADTIQLSCASAARVDLFITNDERLSEKIIPGIQFITSLQRAYL